MNKRRIAAGMSGLMLLSGALFGAASAHESAEEDAGSSISIAYKPRKAKLAGTVTSRTACVGDRSVKVFKARTGAKVGATRTNATGGWSLSGIKKNTGKYYAKVTAQTVVLAHGTDQYGDLWQHLLNCGGDKSGTVGT